jgi:hypothetical protein
MSPTLNSSPYAMATTAAPCTDPCVQTCPSCGGLQCLCRPRFFAGQLLTDDDLSLLNSYIVEKNKLHNRYLHGWGVVCGMEVTCNPCNNRVTVKSGYALSPCGEDIIVCQDTLVDICALIQRCQKQTPSDCQPLALGADDPCSSGPEDWILFIRYAETMSRGVTSLKGASGTTCTPTCSCGSGCGGASKSKSNGNACSCGCTSSASTSAPASSTALAQCEPTAVCEGYTFDICKVPATSGRKTQDPSALIDRVLCCFKAILPEFTLPPTDPTLWKQWCCQVRQNLVSFFAANPISDCQIGTLLSNMCNNQDPRMAVAQVLWEYLRSCLCSAFLPPCPCPVSDDRVPLATITIQKSSSTPCTLVEVCNINVRKFATTFPALQYWLSPFGVFAQGLRQGLARICCNTLEIPDVQLDQQAPAGAQRAVAAAAVAVAPDPMQTFSTYLVNSFLERSQTLTPQYYALAGLGLTHDGGQAFVSGDDLNHPFEAMFLNQVAWPVAQAAFPPNLSDVLLRFIGFGAQPAPAPAPAPAPPPVAGAGPALDALKSQLADLQHTVKEQQSKIDDLHKHLRKK